MVQSNQISPGMTISINDVLYRVESSVKVTVPKGLPFIKTKLREVATNKIIEKNFKPNVEVKEISLDEKSIEFLYAEGKDFLFLDYIDLNQILVPFAVVGDKINYLKEGTKVLASFYGDAVFSIELPQYLELMIAKIDEESTVRSGTNKRAMLETGAKLEVPSFVDVGDIIKIDTKSNEYIQRV